MSREPYGRRDSREEKFRTGTDREDWQHEAVMTKKEKKKKKGVKEEEEEED